VGPRARLGELDKRTLLPIPEIEPRSFSPSIVTLMTCFSTPILCYIPNCEISSELKTMTVNEI
jgi:hypothetical protein